MKLPKNYLENLSSSTYKEYMKILPSIGKDSTHTLTILIFTVLALIVFGVFAISPTISTIVSLRKQISDSQYVNTQLQTKIRNLTSLDNEYKQIQNDLPVLYDALPKDPQATLLAGQIQALLQQTKLQVVGFHVQNVIIAPKIANQDVVSSISFTLQLEGDYQDMQQFATFLSQFNRIVTIQNFTITRDPKNNSLLLNIDGKGYFKN